MTEGPTRRARRRDRAPQSEFVRSQAALERLASDGIRVSARIADLESGAALLRVDDYAELPVGSLGELLMLIEASARMTAGEVPELTRSPEDAAEGAGLWQNLVIDTLPMEDVATLIASNGDRLASNVLLREIGLGPVAARAEELGLRNTALLDGVSARADRPGRARQSRTTMTEFSELIWRLRGNAIVDSETSGRVLSWLWQSVDPGFVFGVAGLDPRAQPTESALHATVLVSRERGMHAEAGIIESGGSGVCFSIAVCFTGDERDARNRVREALEIVGAEVLDSIRPETPEAADAPRGRRAAR